MNNFYLDSETFRGSEINGIEQLALLDTDWPSNIKDRISGAEHLIGMGNLSLQKDKDTFVFYMAEEGEDIPSVFLVSDVETTLGFKWPILWQTEDVIPVPDFMEIEGQVFTIIKGTALIITEKNQDEWLSVIPNAICMESINLY